MSAPSPTSAGRRRRASMEEELDLSTLTPAQQAALSQLSPAVKAAINTKGSFGKNSFKNTEWDAAVNKAQGHASDSGEMKPSRSFLNRAGKGDAPRRSRYKVTMLTKQSADMAGFKAGTSRRTGGKRSRYVRAAQKLLLRTNPIPLYAA